MEKFIQQNILLVNPQKSKLLKKKVLQTYRILKLESHYVHFDFQTPSPQIRKH